MCLSKEIKLANPSAKKQDKGQINPDGVDCVLEGWIEDSYPGFQTEGHYYVITSENGVCLERFEIRHGLLMSMEPAYPEVLLVPAKIVIEQGRHVSVRPNLESSKTINRALIADKYGYVVRNGVAQADKKGETQIPLDYVINLPQSSAFPEIKEKPIKVFISYCHEDESFCEQLQIHLSGLVRKKVLTSWYDRKITPGVEIDPEIEGNLRESQIIMLLVSPDFIASEYCMSVEMEIAMEMHKNNDALIIPTILRVSDWHDEDFGKLMALPKDGNPISKWEDKDEAYLDIIKGIKKVVRRLNNPSSV